MVYSFIQKKVELAGLQLLKKLYFTGLIMAGRYGLPEEVVVFKHLCYHLINTSVEFKNKFAIKDFY